MNQAETVKSIVSGRTALGLEFGSTRIKSVLIDMSGAVLASGCFVWENSFRDGRWTYSLQDAVRGMQASYADLKHNVAQRYGATLRTIGCIGISGMMHGLIALDSGGRQIMPFLTWRNTNAAQAAGKLSELFCFNVPMRWTVSQIYQAVLEKHPGIRRLGSAFTLAAYIHMRLSGTNVAGIGEASGMFPVDTGALDYDRRMLGAFDSLITGEGLDWKLRDVLPRVLCAGDDAGSLTAEGSRLLDPDGDLVPGIPMAPPEGDAGTGMVATDSVAPRTGNVSVGTSVFSMSVLEKPLERAYRDIDIVCTPAGRDVAMVHCNNGTTELDRWIGLFDGMLESFGIFMSRDRLYEGVFRKSLEGDPGCGGITGINFVSGEPVAGVLEGLPLLTCSPEKEMRFTDFVRAQMYSVFASLALGHRILEKENVRIDRVTGHGGFFKVAEVGQRHLSAALGVPVSVTETAGEGGPYGMALLAAFRVSQTRSMGLEKYLERIFSDAKTITVTASDEEIAGFRVFLDRFCRLMKAEKALVSHNTTEVFQWE